MKGAQAPGELHKAEVGFGLEQQGVCVCVCLSAALLFQLCLPWTLYCMSGASKQLIAGWHSVCVCADDAALTTAQQFASGW